MRYAAVLDATTGRAEERARALAGFLSGGLTVEAASAGDTALSGQTLILYDDEGDRERLLDLAPTADVRLVRVPARRPDVVVEVLATSARAGDLDLFLFAGGPAGTEVTTRLARRTGGAVLTDALSVAVRPTRLLGRRSIYSNHLVGRFELTSRPWCVSVDAGWREAPEAAPQPHRIVSDTDERGRSIRPPFADVELVAPPATGDLDEARFVVVAGNGAGGRDGVARIAAAARRMGAAFGVTRPVAMNAWAPMDRLIGVSGARVAPAVCLVAGASGAPAFLWGVERAGLIVAVNPDERAAIVAAADATVLGDGVAVVEALADLLAESPRGD